ncbi:MAG: hypothetical protein ACYC6C_03115 [Coriobacteriia bacterium]
MRRYLSATFIVACLAATLFGTVTAGAVGPVTVTYQGAFGTEGLGNGQFTNPRDVATSANANKIYELRYLGGTEAIGSAVRASAAPLLH